MFWVSIPVVHPKVWEQLLQRVWVSFFYPAAHRFILFWILQNGYYLCQWFDVVFLSILDYRLSPIEHVETLYYTSDLHHDIHHSRLVQHYGR